MNAYYRSNPSLIVTRDKDAIGTKRPQKFIQQEEDEFKKTMRRASIAGVDTKDGNGPAQHVEGI
jgi:hypothetical protein